MKYDVKDSLITEMLFILSSTNKVLKCIKEMQKAKCTIDPLFIHLEYYTTRLTPSLYNLNLIIGDKMGWEISINHLYVQFC